MVSIEGLGIFEGYPNRDSLSYAALYGIPQARTMFRGTLRYPGWCATMKKIADVGFLGQDERDLRGRTYGSLLRELAGLPPAADLKTALPGHWGSRPDPRSWIAGNGWACSPRSRSPWSAAPPSTSSSGSCSTSSAMARARRDMIVLRHEFRYASVGGEERSAASTLIDYGRPGGDSSMARTVGLPAAVAARLVLDGGISRKGVCLPVHPEIYGPSCASSKAGASSSRNATGRRLRG